MPNSCAVFGCKINYNDDHRVPVFKLPTKPDNLRHRWLQVLRRYDLQLFKGVYMCVNHFRQEDFEYTHKVPNGDGTYREIPRVNPKLKDGAVPVFLPGHPSICSQSITSTKRRRVSPTSKDEEMFNEALTLSLASESEDKEKYQINCFQDIQAKLPLLSLPKTWSLWYPDDHSLIYMLPLLTEHNIIVNTHILVSFDLSVRAYRNGEILPLPICSISDIRHLESILCEISKSPRPVLSTESVSKTVNETLSLAKDNIQLLINKVLSSNGDLELTDSTEISRLQFIQCQLENSIVPKNRRRYNILTQVMALKAHLISPACYKYLQQMACLSLPHVNTLEKLYSSFGLECEFFPFLKQATNSFTEAEKHIVMQMDEIHVRSDVTYKGGKIYGSSLSPEDPVKTVFAIMVSSLQKKWSTIVRLLPCASLSAEKIFPIILACIKNIETCGLCVDVISTDNYPLNVKLFKLFSPVGKLETCVPDPCVPNRPLYLTFDFVHILKSVRNNWLNLKSSYKCFSTPILTILDLIIVHFL